MSAVMAHAKTPIQDVVAAIGCDGDSANACGSLSTIVEMFGAKTELR